MNNIRITVDEKCAMAYDFELADDLYLFFKFGSPNSDCEIGIAFDQYVDGGEWYVNDGHLGSCDHRTIDDIIFDKLYNSDEFRQLVNSVDDAIRAFNGTEV